MKKKKTSQRDIRRRKARKHLRKPPKKTVPDTSQTVENPQRTFTLSGDIVTAMVEDLDLLETNSEIDK